MPKPRKRFFGVLLRGAFALALALAIIWHFRAQTGSTVPFEMVLVDDELDPFVSLDDRLLLPGMSRFEEGVVNGTVTYVVYEPAPPIPFADALAKANAWATEHVWLRPGTRVAWQREEARPPAPFVLRSFVLWGAPMIAQAGVRDVWLAPPRPAHEIELYVSFDDATGRRFSEVTRHHVGRRIAIMLDGVVHCAPEVKAHVAGGEVLMNLGPESTSGRLVAQELVVALGGKP